MCDELQGQRANPMRAAAKFLCVWLSVVLLVTPLLASAQTPTAPATPPPPPPDLYQEALKASAPEEKPNQAAYDAGAAVVSVFLAPGRAFLCAIGSGAAVVVLAITFGTGYGAAKRIFEEGCVGPYVLTGDDLRRENERQGIATDSYLK